MLLSMVPVAFAAEVEPQGLIEGNNTVTIRVIGSSVPEKKPSLSNSKYDYGGAEYQNWLKTTSYKVADGTTVQQVIAQVRRNITIWMVTHALHHVKALENIN